MKSQLYLALVAVLCLAACGTPGAPRPPSLELPRPVNDLAATRQGDKVTLTWTAPRQTTDGANIRRPGPERICRDVAQATAVSCAAIAELPPVTEVGTRQKPVTRGYTDVLPPALQREHPAAFASYAVAAYNDRGRTAGVSNQVQVPLAPTLPPPNDVRAQVTPEGIVLTWTGMLHEHEVPELRHVFRIYRRAAQTAGIVVGEVQLSTDPHARFLDTGFEWEATYHYRVVVVTLVGASGSAPVQVEGDPSAEVTVVAHDVFPPAAPEGLQAVASGVGQAPFIDLTWAPNSEADLAGYNVYRHEAGQPPVKINTELVKTPAYRDRAVAAGHKYVYAVSAVDLRGNESARSAEASESVP